MRTFFILLNHPVLKGGGGGQKVSDPRFSRFVAPLPVINDRSLKAPAYSMDTQWILNGTHEREGGGRGSHDVVSKSKKKGLVVVSSLGVYTHNGYSIAFVGVWIVCIENV